MLTSVIMPQLSLSMRFGVIVEWLRAEGDFVQQGESLCIVEGDKATIEVESPATGYIKRIIAKVGEEFPVKQPMAVIGDLTDRVDALSPAADSELDSATPLVAESDSPGTMPPVVVNREPGRVKASPVAKRVAAELGVDLATVVGTGPDGLISKEDVIAAKASATESTAATNAPAETAHEVTPSNIKKLVAERMKVSYLDAPHIHLTLTCIMTEADRWRRQFNSHYEKEAHATFTDMILWAAGRALKAHELLNAALHEGRIIVANEVNIGFAVATERGLIVPVVRNADRRSLLEIAQMRQSLTEKVRENRQSVDELSGGTFTVTNLGMFEIEAFDAILNPGQAGILSVGKVQKSVVADDEGRISVQQTMTVTLACDHRVADGIDGARFLAYLKRTLESPADMFDGLLPA